MKKSILSISFIFLFFLVSYAQETYKFEFQKECGNPEVESHLNTVFKGKVLRINPDNTIKVKSDKGKKIIVILAGIDLSENKDELNKILTEKLLGKKIMYFGNSEEKTPNKIEAEVEINKFEINRFLIEKRISKYKDTDYGYSVSRYQFCVYRQLEEKAKTAKLGIWAK